MPRMRVQRAGHNDGIEILHVEQSPMIVKRANTRDHLACFIAASTVNIGDGYELNIAD